MDKFEWGSPSSGALLVGGQKLEAKAFGPPPGSAPTIVMLHEGLGCVDLWRSFPEKLAEKTGFGVFVYSRAGYGNSAPINLPRPLDYMTREAKEVLPGVLDAIGFEYGIILGHSDGASIAAIYGGGVEDFRIRGLVLIAPHFFTEPSGLASIRKAKDDYDDGDLRARLSKYHANVDVAFRGWNDAWLDPGFENWNIAESIDYLRIPVLAIQGADDQYGTMAQINEIENRIYSPLDVEIIADCKHSPHIEKSNQTLEIIEEYCARLDRIEKQVVNLR